MADLRPGARFRCETCGTEIVVIKADADVIECCGVAMADPAPAKSASA